MQLNTHTHTVQYWVWPGDPKMELQDINNRYYKSSPIQHPWVGCSVWPATVCAMAAWVDILVRAWQWLLAPRVLGTAVVPMVVTRRCVALMSTGQGCCRGNTPHPPPVHNHVTVVFPTPCTTPNALYLNNSWFVFYSKLGLNGPNGPFNPAPHHNSACE